ncbi:GNAT family N-acetyltransferase [Terasakiella sp. A23]|uniref:GNAT family N-acetyltransferase n=1 Tax=Terasakiella sp. FCG-A23 TaxID=3080561 RepID=UPI0029539C36|nr:GNAT family N-acetyltransferase [Terasakiella sp. A23]MDV7338571.1 GNAT family N-acetyltransferase [Terasakiella sp. A23]
MASSNSNKIDILEKISDISPADWNSCVGADEPFARHEFLSALEDSNCTTPKAGWMAQHIVLRNDEGKILGCSPVYLKGHSYGEYVFDWSWADAYERAGGRYYPKLQCAIPFTPVSSHRLLMHPDANKDNKAALLEGMINHAKALQISSLHITFSTEDEWHLAKNQGMMGRTGHQYHWENRGYETFDDFLATLSSRKRKSIKKERKSVAESGIEIKALSGDELEEHHWDAFYAFYLDTTGRKWGHPYLNREFFGLLGQRLADQVVLIVAMKDERIVAGALNLKGNKTIYGRNWGCLEDYRFLHFEACYYQAIDYAITHKLARVEAGAQGQHKIQRGYLPVKTYSSHWVRDPGFADAVEKFLDHDQKVNDAEMTELAKFSPYKTT